MPKDPGPLDKLVRTQEEINPQHRQFQHKSGQKAQGDGIAPHIHRITDKAEAAVTAGPEYAGDQCGIYRGTHNIVDIYEQHILQVMHGGLCQGRIFQHKRRGRQDNQAADGSGDDCELHQLFSIFILIYFCIFYCFIC